MPKSVPYFQSGRINLGRKIAKIGPPGPLAVKIGPAEPILVAKTGLLWESWFPCKM